MEWISEDEFEQAVDRVIRQPMCVQGWQGYGSVLFLGFGDHILPPVIHGKDAPERVKPAYELHTVQSCWIVIDAAREIVGHSEGTRELAGAALSSIIGLHIAGLELYKCFSLDIQFSNGFKLLVRRFPKNTDPEDEIYGVREPDGFISFVRYNGQTYRIHEHEPLNTVPRAGKSGSGSSASDSFGPMP